MYLKHNLNFKINLNLLKCQNIKFYLNFIDSNGFICQLNSFNLTNGCCSLNYILNTNGDENNHENNKGNYLSQHPNNHQNNQNNQIQNQYQYQYEQLEIVNSPLFGNQKSTRFSCETCDTESYCCNKYENCVSCCNHPSHIQLSEELKIRELHYAHFAIRSMTQFDWCAFICRSSSVSLSDSENSFRSDLHHCFLSRGPTEIYPSINSDQRDVKQRKTSETHPTNEHRYLRSFLLHDHQISKEKNKLQ